MREAPAGDFDYEETGHAYSSVRKSEPRFGVAIRKAFGDAKRVLNVGAGAGSYEPEDLDVVALEPSAVMRAQRPAHLVEAIDGVAEELPFGDCSFDASLASITIHQWRDLGAGLKEMRRVAKGPVVILTFEPVALQRFWLSEFAPEMMQYESGRMPALDEVAAHLGGSVEVSAVPIPHDCVDGFAEAFYGRPEAFLDESVRRSQSAWGFVSPDVEEASVARLSESLRDGTWDQRHGSLRRLLAYEGSLRLVVAMP
jgi:SAM-dependent methyltransferase